MEEIIKMKPKIKHFSSDEVEKIDKGAIREVPEKTLMENAGKKLANFVEKFNPKKVIVIYGKGNNGGDGLVAAKYLIKKNINVIIIPASENVNENVKFQLNKLEQANSEKLIKIGNFNEIKEKLNRQDIIIDSLLGYNQNGNPRGRYAKLIKKANKIKEKCNLKIISLDVPTGLDPDSGAKKEPCINFDYVLTLGVAKKGLRNMKNIYLADIGFLNEVYENNRINKPYGIVKIS